MPSIRLSVHNVFLDAKRVYASVHFTEDHKLGEIMKDQFFFRHPTAVTWDTWRCDCLNQGLVLELLLPIKVLLKVPIRKPLQVNAQKIAFDRQTREFFFSSSGSN